MIRRNERQRPGDSVEELTYITERLDLTEPLTRGTLGANLGVERIPEFSRLPKGTKLLFPSGAVLLVEEYNPPCTVMGPGLRRSTPRIPASYSLTIPDCGRRRADAG